MRQNIFLNQISVTILVKLLPLRVYRLVRKIKRNIITIDPSIYEFYSSLNESHVTAEDYKHKKFEIILNVQRWNNIVTVVVM